MLTASRNTTHDPIPIFPPPPEDLNSAKASRHTPSVGRLAAGKNAPASGSSVPSFGLTSRGECVSLREAFGSGPRRGYCRLSATSVPRDALE
jgi:hypothetical protein